MLDSTGHCFDPEGDADLQWSPYFSKKIITSTDERFLWYEVFGQKESTTARDVKVFFDVLVTAFGEIPDESDWTGDGLIKGPQIELTVLDPQVREIRLAVGQESVTERRFVEPGMVSPLVVLDPVSQIDDDPQGDSTVTLTGTVQYPVEVADDTETALFVNGEKVTPAQDGTFSHATRVRGYYDVITATAYNELGGWGRDSIRIIGDAIHDEEHLSPHPVMQRLSFGSSSVADFLRSKQTVDLVLKPNVGVGCGAGEIDRITIPLEEIDGAIVTKRFVISEQADVRPPLGAGGAYGSIAHILKFVPPNSATTEPLEHDLWVEIDGGPYCRIQMAGIRITSPGRGIVEDDEVGEHEGEQMVTNDEFIPWPITVYARNVAENSFAVHIHSDALSHQAELTTSFVTFEFPDGNQYAPSAEFIRGRNVLMAFANDTEGDALEASVAHVFAWNNAIPHWSPVLRHELDEPGVVVAALQGGGGEDPHQEEPWLKHETDLRQVEFPVLWDTPMEALFGEAERLGLRVIVFARRSRNSDCADPENPLSLVYALVEPLDGNYQRAIAAVQSSPIYEDADEFEQPHLLDCIRNPPDATGWVWWNDLMSDGKDWAAAERQAEIEMNKANWQGTLTALTKVQQLAVVDMRVDKEQTHFDLGVPVVDSLVKLGEVALNAKLRHRPYQQIYANGPEFHAELENWGSDSLGADPYYRFRHYDTPTPIHGRLDNTPPPPVDQGGYPPRLAWSRQDVPERGLPGSDVDFTNKRGVIITVHGFCNETELEDFNVDGNVDLLRTLWPISQYLYVDVLEDIAENPSDWAILHVLWTGDWHVFLSNAAGVPDEALWFNWDGALARYTGDEMLWRLLRDIQYERDPDPYDTDWHGIVVQANSLGNRVVVSALDQLRSQLPFEQYPKIRYVMGHPALRRENLRPSGEFDVQGIATGPGKIDTRLQEELSGMMGRVGTPPDDNQVLMFSSKYDKAGLAFSVAQGTAMLGRCGLPSSYVDDEDKLVRISDVWGGHPDIPGQDVGHPDLWHVKLMGWHLPGMVFQSRPTYHQNSALWEVTDPFKMAGSSSSRRVIKVDQKHIDNIWNVIREFVRNGSTPSEAMP